MSTDISLAENEERSLSLTAPSFMSADAAQGVEELNKYVVPPRIKIIQKQSGEEIVNRFGKGSAILTPQQFLVASMEAGKKQGEPFYIVPLLFFPEWATINPIQMKGTLPMLRERTQDPHSRLAKKAMDATLRMEACPEKPELKMRHTEFLNFIVVILGNGDAAGIPVVMSFSRGEHGRGGAFATLLKQRCGRSKTPVFGCQFRAQVGHRSNQQGDWFGIDVSNPTEDDVAAGVGPFVTDNDIYDRFKMTHTQLKEQLNAQLIQVSHDDDAIIDEPVDSAEF
jgi:hypothetical protein